MQTRTSGVLPLGMSTLGLRIFFLINSSQTGATRCTGAMRYEEHKNWMSYISNGPYLYGHSEVQCVLVCFVLPYYSEFMVFVTCWSWAVIFTVENAFKSAFSLKPVTVCNCLRVLDTIQREVLSAITLLQVGSRPGWCWLRLRVK